MIGHGDLKWGKGHVSFQTFAQVDRERKFCHAAKTLSPKWVDREIWIDWVETDVAGLQCVLFVAPQYSQLYCNYIGVNTNQPVGYSRQ
jgi:hypothetical protein